MEEQDGIQGMSLEEKVERRRLFKPIIKQYEQDNNIPDSDEHTILEGSHLEAIKTKAQAAGIQFVLGERDLRHYLHAKSANA